MRRRLFVVEARRLLPLLFLLILLVSLSVYDTFRASPTVVPERAAPGSEVAVITVDKGERKEMPVLRLAVDEEAWKEIASEWAVTLPQYPFQAQHEVALFALHAEVQKVETVTLGDALEVRVRLGPKRDNYHVVMLPAKDVVLAAGQTTWIFVDKKGAVLEQFTIGEAAETAADEVPKK